MTQSAKSKSTRRMGRPTAAQSQALDERIKTEALELFLEHGFDLVTMEAVAEKADITKRTLYMRYKDKSALFVAAMRTNAKDVWRVPDVDEVTSSATSLGDRLYMLAEALLDQALNPRIVKLARIAAAQANAFPEEVKSSYNMSLSPRIKSVVALLELHRDELNAASRDNLEMIAELFIGIITGVPARLAGMGTLRDRDFERQRIRLAVDVFLVGITSRQ